MSKAMDKARALAKNEFNLEEAIKAQNERAYNAPRKSNIIHINKNPTNETIFQAAFNRAIMERKSG